MARVRNVVLIALLLAVTGSQWAMLQSYAWTMMLAHNLRTECFTEAVAHTFDGKHPCRLCKAIQNSKKSERKQTPTRIEVKIDFWLAPVACLLIAPPAASHAWPHTDAFYSRVETPPTPPPRLA